MANLKPQIKGIAGIYRANAVDLIVFGAVFYQRTQNQSGTLRETIQSVALHFGISETSTIDALELGYRRAESAYLQNGGL